jgi:Fe-S cluster biogenesis protein NfuA
MFEEKELQQQIQEIESLVRKIELACDPDLRISAQKLVQLLMDLHGAGVNRIMEIVSRTGDPGRSIIEDLARDNLVGNLLLLYGLHPVDPETRVREALDKVRPLLHSHGASVDLLGIADGVVRLRLKGSCHGCESSAMTLRSAIERAIHAVAPDVTALEVEGLMAQPVSPDFVPLDRLQRQFTTKRMPAASCELCSLELVPDHQHLFEPSSRKLLCACDACAILFGSQGEMKYRRVPRRIRFMPGFHLSDAQWDRLMVPVNMAFFFNSSPARKVVAVYPSAAGPTESLLALEAWEEIVQNNPSIQAMEADVEALLVNRVSHIGESGSEYYLAPIDECYKLVGLVRGHWRGLSGGTQLLEQVGQFFAGLKGRSSEPIEGRISL